MKVFPTALLCFDSMEFDIERRSISGGTALSGEEDVVETDGGGRWYAALNEAYLDDPEIAAAWDALSGQLGGGTVPIIVPFTDATRQMQGETPLPPAGMPWWEEDDILAMDPGATVIDPAPLFSTTLRIAIGALPAELKTGIPFSIDHPTLRHRPYKVVEIVENNGLEATIRIHPPLREAVDASAPADFLDPKCVMRVAGEMRGPRTLGYAEGSVRFVEHFPADFYVSAAVPAQGITNHFNPANGHGAVNMIAEPDGTLSPVGGFLIAGYFDPGDGDFTFSSSAGPRNFLEGPRVNFYSALPFGPPTLVASVTDTDGVELSADGQTLFCPAALNPGAPYGVVTSKYAIEGIFSTGNVIPDGALAALQAGIMVNHGPVATVLNEYGAAGTVDDIDDPLEMPVGSLLVCKHGEQLFPRIRFGDVDLVMRLSFETAAYDKNTNIQYNSIVAIDPDVSGPRTVGAFFANYSPTPAEHTYYITNDNDPAYRLQGIFAGGNHSLVSWRIKMVGHGKTNADRGSWWGKGGRDWQISRVDGPDHIIVTAAITGDDNFWVPYTNSPGTGTFTHVRGATHTADIVVSDAPVQTQLYSTTQQVSRWARLDGGKIMPQNGAYVAGFLDFGISYGIANFKAVQEHIEGQAGNLDDIQYNSTHIPPQVRVAIACRLDGFGAIGYRYEVTAIEPHYQDSMWGSQHQPLTHRPAEGETLHFFAQGVVPFGAGETQSGGSVKDFASVAAILDVAKDYYFDRGIWLPASAWKDGRVHAPRVFMHGVRDGDDEWIKKRVMVHDPLLGLTGSDSMTRAMYLSSAGKAYMWAAGKHNVAARWRDTAYGGFGPMRVDFDPEALVNFPWPRLDGSYGFAWHRDDPTPITYRIPVHPNLIGRKLVLCYEQATVTVYGVGRPIEPAGIKVTTTGAGGFMAIAARR